MYFEFIHPPEDSRATVLRTLSCGALSRTLPTKAINCFREDPGFAQRRTSATSALEIAFDVLRACTPCGPTAPPTCGPVFLPPARVSVVAPRLTGADISPEARGLDAAFIDHATGVSAAHENEPKTAVVCCHGMANINTI